MDADRELFDRVFEQALGGDTIDCLIEKHRAAIGRGDWERVRFIDELIRMAAILGTNAVTAERTRRERS
jgi:hypothetical protein